MKYARLTKEQFEELNKEFINFLATQSITADEWQDIKANKPEVAEEELDVFSPTKKVGLKRATPAQILQKILMDTWTLDHDDKDMLVMYHKFGYELDGKKHQIDSTMVCIGEDQTYTAMAKTVGLPVAMATLAILNGKITTPGVQIPINKEVYTPILEELEDYGIVFHDKNVPYLGYNPLNV